MTLKRIFLLVCLVAVLAPLVTPARAQSVQAASAIDEYLVKGAFLLNIAKFVEWPAFCLAESQKEFTIGILGMNPFSDTLANLARDKKIQGRTIRIRHYKRVEDVDKCQMLFIGASEARKLNETFRVLQGRGIVTVADFRGFAAQGGMIGLLVLDNRVQFEINEATARREQVKMSAQLLKLAMRVISAKR